MFAVIMELLQESGITARDLGGVGVGRGPGSFTGVRNAVMVAKTLSWALRVSLYATSTLDALAWGEPHEGVTASLIDARRGQVYLRVFRREKSSLMPLTEPLALSPQKARDLIFRHSAEQGMETALVGTGAHAYREAFEGLGRTADDPYPRPQGLLLACSAAASEGPRDPLALAPLYLRDPDAAPRASGSGRGKGECL